MDMKEVLQFIGAIAFGLVVGWLTYFILRRVQPKAISDLSTIIGILGGAAITGLFDPKGTAFAGYAIGLAIGFFAYYAIYVRIVGSKNLKEFLINEVKGGGGLILGEQDKSDKSESKKNN